MSVLRCCWRSMYLLLLLMMASVDCWVRRPRVGAEGAVWIHGWCRRIVKAMGVSYVVEGRLPRGGALVCNHLSYLDILLFSAITPFVMVSKREVRGWPVLGWLTARAGTVYVERGGGPSTYAAVNAAMAEAYGRGLPVIFFPEGTTTDGAYAEGGVMPFRRGLFHSVLDNGVALRVAGLRYWLEEETGGVTVGDAVCWWGDALLAPHLLRLLGLRGVRARVRFGGEVLARTDRFALSETARAEVAELYAGLGEDAGLRRGLGEVELVEAL